jgi:hypothetical protein
VLRGVPENTPPRTHRSSHVKADLRDLGRCRGSHRRQYPHLEALDRRGSAAGLSNRSTPGSTGPGQRRPTDEADRGGFVIEDILVIPAGNVMWIKSRSRAVSRSIGLCRLECVCAGQSPGLAYWGDGMSRLLLGGAVWFGRSLGRNEVALGGAPRSAFCRIPQVRSSVRVTRDSRGRGAGRDPAVLRKSHADGAWKSALRPTARPLRAQLGRGAERCWLGCAHATLLGAVVRLPGSSRQ